ncbi:heavy metal-binding protein HIP-like [Mercenaria mercenaria]|uniref:heavy metal-binding protein HIP-like n=1 Tax=Mercenaria mercenaria TaxID=6596 RepID=UPI00234E897A|nr:heavy metal-binding protein HIP-like [Mercenaria mercenaria]
MIINLLFRTIFILQLLFTCKGSIRKRILVDDNFYTLVNKLDALEKEVATLKANAANNNTIQALKQDVALLKMQQAKQTNTVAFMAYLTTHERGTNHHILFDDVKTNIGNAYNPRHGVFIAPVDGLYQFSVTACSVSQHYIVLELNVKDTVLGKVIAGNGWAAACNSKVFLVQLAQGDDVFVTHTTTGEWLYANAAYGVPNFTGLLIKET